MKRVTDSGQLLEQIAALMKAGVVTNAMPNREKLERETAAETLYVQEQPEGLLLFYRRPTHDLMTWLLRRGAGVPTVEPERDTVLELPCRTGDRAAAEIREQWAAQGFAPILSRVRLTRRALPCEAGAPNPAVYLAHPGDAQWLMTLLQQCFPAKTGCIPGMEALQNAIAAEQILCTTGGLLQLEKNGRTTEIRHLAVDAHCRGRGTGSALTAEYIRRYGGGLCRVWTGETNQPALRLYQKAGFCMDGWRSEVMEYRKDV